MLLNPNVPHRQKAYENLAFTKITIPILHIISGKEHKAVTDSQLADHRAPYDHIVGSDQYLITLVKSDQANLSDRHSASVDERDGLIQEIVSDEHDQVLGCLCQRKFSLKNLVDQRRIGSRPGLKRETGKEDKQVIPICCSREGAQTSHVMRL